VPLGAAGLTGRGRSGALSWPTAACGGAAASAGAAPVTCRMASPLLLHLPLAPPHPTATQPRGPGSRRCSSARACMGRPLVGRAYLPSGGSARGGGGRPRPSRRAQLPVRQRPAPAPRPDPAAAVRAALPPLSALAASPSARRWHVAHGGGRPRAAAPRARSAEARSLVAGVTHEAACAARVPMRSPSLSSPAPVCLTHRQGSRVPARRTWQVSAGCYARGGPVRLPFSQGGRSARAGSRSWGPCPLSQYQSYTA